MTKITLPLLTWSIILSLLLSACQPATHLETAGGPKVLAVESFLADMAQNVAGKRLAVESLIPFDVDPHTFEPTPRDVAKITDSRVLIVNGAGLEDWLMPLLTNAGGERQVIEAAAGLTSRITHDEETAETSPSHSHEGDPHFWLDPICAIQYVENIRDGLIAADPAGTDLYTQNAAEYIARLKALDAYIWQQVSTIPPERRLLVTNHESFGYFADRYGLTIIGAIIPSVSSGASPSAQQFAQLIEQIEATHAPAIFLESGADPRLAEQIRAETGIRMVTDLFTHSLTGPDGKAPSYLAMLKYDADVIVEALK